MKALRRVSGIIKPMSTSARGERPAGISWYIGYLLLLLLLAAFAALFYFDGFTYLLSNSSSSFNVEVCRTEIRLHRNANVLVIGNSTAAEDFRTTLFNSQAKDRQAINLGIPGGHFFLFEKMMKMSRAMGVRPHAAVLILTPDVLSLRPDFDYLLNDLGTLKIRLDLGDVATLARHSRAVPQYLDYASRVLLRPVLFRGDLADLFTRPLERWHEARRIRKWLDGLRAQDPPPESNNAFEVCSVPSLDRLSQEIQEQRRAGHADVAAELERVEAGYAVRIHQPLRVDEFETVRFERVLRRLVQNAGRVYVVQAPYYDPAFEQYPAAYRRSYESTVSAVVQRTPGATLVPDFAADCGMFFDTVHLNAAGAARFTTYLRSYIAARHRIARTRHWQAKPAAPPCDAV